MHRERRLRFSAAFLGPSRHFASLACAQAKSVNQQGA